MLTQHPPSIGENVIKRLPSQRYDELKASIRDPQFRQAVELLEEHALIDRFPWVEPNEIDRVEVGTRIYLTDAKLGAMLAYEVEDDGIRFLAFADMFNR